MVKVRKSLTSLDEFLAAIDGYEHMDSQVLIAFLLENYTLDLDLIPEFVATLAQFTTAAPVAAEHQSMAA